MRRIVAERLAERLGTIYPRKSISEQGPHDSFTQKRATEIQKVCKRIGIVRALRETDAAIRLPRSGGGDSGCVATDRLLPDPAREAANDPDAVRVAAGADGIDRGAAAGGDEAGYSPSRWRFRYRPFREIPSALATALTLPRCSFKAARIVSHSMRAQSGFGCSAQESPKRCRLRYSPLREMPNAFAAAVALP